MVTKDTPVINVLPDISKEVFRRILESASSPALVESDQCYTAIVASGVSPAFCLAIFMVESAFGTVGLAVQNKSPGNTRSSITGRGMAVQTTKGTFIRYPTWLDGFRDLAARFVAKDYLYARSGLTTIGGILSVFAPASDGNNPDLYINSAVRLMTAWLEKGGNSMVLVPTAGDIGFPVRLHWAYDVGPDRPLSSVTKDIIHDTEGNMASDEGELTRDDAKIASCHALIAPSGELVFMVPITKTAWTPGNDSYARASINIEISGFASKGYTDAQYKSTAAFHRWCVAQGCPIPAEYIGRTGKAGILGHQDVPNPFQAGSFGGASGHTDPGSKFDWGKFIALCKDGAITTMPPPTTKTYPTGKTLAFGFLAFYDKLAAASPNLELLTLGYPITNEFDFSLGGKTRTVQLFERGALVFEKDNAAPWDVHCLTIPELTQALDVAMARGLLN